MNFRVVVLLVVALLALLTGACSKNVSPPPSPEPAAAADAGGRGDGADRQPKLLPLPGEQRPAGNPAVGSGPLTWSVPEGWVEVPAASAMRQAQYRVPGPGGDGECIVFYFGPGQGGDPASNAIRWAKQFAQPDGSSSVEKMTMKALEGMPVPVQIVEVTGTYDGGMTMTDAPAEKKAGHMLLGTIAQAPSGSWFFKFTGPESTVRAQRDGLIGMMESLSSGS